ncbi:hypothetical protein CIPAW_10G033800 [Carya illinoinensis]|uniref:Uncharacterized protein n=1 Tax=Carya illinoinensis TaxID=32201 RepID=A0A8T1P8B4_CARIL|nr:hypothetical protein CIPAW_10G033800 [Carya illinoinensis]
MLALVVVHGYLLLLFECGLVLRLLAEDYGFGASCLGRVGEFEEGRVGRRGH